MSLHEFVRQTFLADDYGNHSRIKLNRHFTKLPLISHVTTEAFGWTLSELIIYPITLNRRRHYGLLGTGCLTSKALNAMFKDAGFADCFMFTTVAERVKRDYSRYYDHYFTPSTAEFKVRVGVREGSESLNWKQLNNQLSGHTLMAALKSNP